MGKGGLEKLELGEKRFKQEGNCVGPAVGEIIRGEICAFSENL